MTSLRAFHALDVLKFNPTNLDPLTETYDLHFYFSYLARWPHLFSVAEGNDGAIAAYLMAKLETSPAHAMLTPNYLPWHAHITALTVAPAARRLGLARILSSTLEVAGDAYNAWFVDLYVRRGNEVAIAMYKGLGYSVYRVVKQYYADSVGGRRGRDKTMNGAAVAGQTVDNPTTSRASKDALDDEHEEGEDAWDMRKSLKRDKTGKHVRSDGETYEVMPEDVW